MDIIIAIITSIIGSFVFSIILYLYGIFARIMPKKISKAYSELFINHVYTNQDHAVKKMRHDINSSKTLRVFALKGDSFSHPREEESFNTILKNANINQKYLISHPNNAYV